MKSPPQQEEDEVEFEIPVYLSKSLNGHLHVLQYPIRPADNTYDDETILNVKVKPESNQIEMEIGINTRMQTFDRSKGEQIALNVDGASRNNRDCEENFFKSNVMDKLVLNSTNVLSDTSRYAIAVMGGNSLHLTPISSIVALRPSFDYLDEADKRSKHDNKENSDDDDGEPKDRKLTVRFAGEESERSKKYRERSYNFLQKKLREEPWVPLEYHRYGSKSSEFETGKLFCAHTNDVVDQFHLDDVTYLQQLVPQPEKKIVGGLPTHLLSNAELRTLPLLERLRAIMFNARVASFREILSTVNVGKKKLEETQTVLKTIQQVAVLVQGNWVAKSDVVFPRDVKENEFTDFKKNSQNDADPVEVKQRIRDYILYCLTQNSTVRRIEICESLNVASSEVLLILKSIAKPIKDGVWECILQPDNAFIKKYSDVAQRQEMIWKSRYEQLAQYLVKNNESSPSSLAAPVTQRKNSNQMNNL